MNRSAKGGARSSLRFEDEGILIHPPHQGVCGRHGTEEQRVTSGELTERSEEHTSELQSRLHLVCRLLLEKKKNNTQQLSYANTANIRAAPVPSMPRDSGTVV